MKPLLPIVLSGCLLAAGAAWADGQVLPAGADAASDAPGASSAAEAAPSPLNPLAGRQEADAPPADTVIPATPVTVPPKAPRPRVRHAPRPIPVDALADETERAGKLWQRTGQAAGVVGSNGTVMYAYGESRPTINCTPLHLCVIQLVTGEQITDLSIGDSVRWKVAASKAGDTPVVVTKPVALGLETNLTVLTDAGRVYYMTLKSNGNNYVPLVQFFNPQEIIEKINARTGQMRAQAQTARETKDATLGKLDPATLDFNYTCTGDAGFKPTQVFSGNGHVYLQMPEDMPYHDAPAVFDQSGDTTQLINSRLARGYTVLDGLPDKFKLVTGVGSDAKTVECSHGPAKSGGKRGNSPWNDDKYLYMGQAGETPHG